MVSYAVDRYGFLPVCIVKTVWLATNRAKNFAGIVMSSLKTGLNNIFAGTAVNGYSCLMNPLGHFKEIVINDAKIGAFNQHPFFFRVHKSFGFGFSCTELATFFIDVKSSDITLIPDNIGDATTAKTDSFHIQFLLNRCWCTALVNVFLEYPVNDFSLFFIDGYGLGITMPVVTEGTIFSGKFFPFTAELVGHPSFFALIAYIICVHCELDGVKDTFPPVFKVMDAVIFKG